MPDFASNKLVIVVAPGNPLNIRSFSDLNRDGLSVMACAPLVPCGAAAQRIEDSTGVRLHLTSEESSVTDVLTKVINGQADAGLVYVTDTLAAGNAVRMVQFAQSSGAVNTCSIAVLTHAKNAGLANRFIALVARNRGRHVLSRAGFAKPL
jgi:molybdate transport system substrate-binding protein